MNRGEVIMSDKKKENRSKREYKAIYVPKGRAKEYSPLALNHYIGCSFACKYCYAPATLRKSKDAFHSNTVVKKDLIADLLRDCQKMKQTGNKDRVLLCFASDPYQPIEQEICITRQVLEMFKEYGINFQLLTKAGTVATKDFDLYKDGDAFACTLTFLDEEKSREWEPNAALPQDRIQALKDAHQIGIETWVSLEPVIEPAETLRIIDATNEFVDQYKVGPINYSQIKGSIDWNSFKMEAEERFNMYDKNYILKEELLELCEKKLRCMTTRKKANRNKPK
jgi:DNA repair photolyase